MRMMTPHGAPRLVTITLPEVSIDGGRSFAGILRERRSMREFSAAPLSLEAAGQLLWAAQGVTSSAGERTAPSAGALYPLEVYLAAGSVDGLASGVYGYRAHGHSLRAYLAGDRRRELADAALGQAAVLKAPAVLVIAARYARTARKYGARSERYVHIEVGHAAQNVYLQARALGLGTVIVGAFDDDAVRAALELAEQEAPLALLPVGAPR
jgi:SagB-type dehydrogenase family enzyme